MVSAMRIMLFPAMLLLLAQSLPAAQPDVVTLRDGDRPVLEYRPAATPFKPYAAQLYTPAGVGVLRDNVPDHKHHHGLMFAVAVDGVDFWSEDPRCGKQIPRGFKSAGGHVGQELAWTAPGGKVVLREQRDVTIHGGPVTLVTWQSRLQPPAGKASVKLSGAHYFGLGARFVTSMDHVAQFLKAAQAAGTVVRGSEKVTPANWCACVGPVGGKTITVAMFDHPANLRHPAHMFTMNVPFAYLAATLHLDQEPLVLQGPLELRYGVALWDGAKTPAQIETVYQRWIKETTKP
jgi:hypothetical protein